MTEETVLDLSGDFRRPVKLFAPSTMGGSVYRYGHSPQVDKSSLPNIAIHRAIRSDPIIKRDFAHLTHYEKSHVGLVRPDRDAEFAPRHKTDAIIPSSAASSPSQPQSSPLGTSLFRSAEVSFKTPAKNDQRFSQQSPMGSSSLQQKRSNPPLPMTLMDIAKYTPPKHRVSATYSEVVKKSHAALLKDLTLKTRISMEGLAKKSKERRRLRKAALPPSLQSGARLSETEHFQPHRTYCTPETLARIERWVRDVGACTPDSIPNLVIPDDQPIDQPPDWYDWYDPFY